MRPPPLSTRERLVETLRRRGPRTVADLARQFRISPVAVRLHLNALERQGLVRTECTRPSRGRPARLYSLTTSSSSLFPQRSGLLALEVLEEVERLAGREVVVEALERRARRLQESYEEAVAGRPGEERLRVLARLRDGEGYLCETVERGREAPELVENHCPVSEVAGRWPEVCRLEAETFSHVLGLPVERVEHILSGGSCCRYRVGRPV